MKFSTALWDMTLNSVKTYLLVVRSPQYLVGLNFSSLVLTKRRNSFQCFTVSMFLQHKRPADKDPHMEVNLVPRPIQVKYWYEANYN